MCETFDIQHNFWREIAKMNVARNGSGVVGFEKPGKVYVFGGFNDQDGPLSSIE